MQYYQCPLDGYQFQFRGLTQLAARCLTSFRAWETVYSHNPGKEEDGKNGGKFGKREHLRCLGQ